MIDAFEPDGKEPRCSIYLGADAWQSLVGETNSLRSRPASELGSTVARNGPAVLVVDASLLELALRIDLPDHVVRVVHDETSARALGLRADLSLLGVTSTTARHELLRAACRLSCARFSAWRRRQQLRQMRLDLRELNAIGLALMSEHDHNALLDQIIFHGKRLTESDGGALFLLDEDEHGAPWLHLEHYVIDSRPRLPVLDLQSVRVDYESVIGYAVLRRHHVVIEDAYAIPASAPFRKNVAFDAHYGYRIKSMLVVPMQDHYRRIVGVLTFVNRKSDLSAVLKTQADIDRCVVPYSGPIVRLARSLAGQAAVSIENAQLHARVESIFGGFIKASVTAVEQRDPTTAGHSMRVARLVKDLALAMERLRTGVYRGVRFSPQQMRELYYASLLHDFGKITVDENVLVKAKKLPPVLYERVNARFDLIRSTMETQYYREILRLRGIDDEESVAKGLATDFASNIEELERWRAVVHRANEPAIERDVPDPELLLIAQHTFVRPDRSVAPYLMPDELHFLQLVHGTLDDRERAIIEQHAEETYRFLSSIPWTDDLSHMAVYARDHHEKLDGTGYPRRLTAPEIPLQTRLITVADIFDALTASDRPYKPAVSGDTAMGILEAEAKAGHVDPEIVRVLSESKVYERILDTDWREF